MHCTQHNVTFKGTVNIAMPLNTSIHTLFVLNYVGYLRPFSGTRTAVDVTHGWRCCHIRLVLNCAHALGRWAVSYVDLVSTATDVLSYAPCDHAACRSPTTVCHGGDSINVLIGARPEHLHSWRHALVASPLANYSSLSLHQASMKSWRKSQSGRLQHCKHETM